MVTPFSRVYPPPPPPPKPTPQTNKEIKQVNDFQIIKTLGAGSFATVKLAHRSTPTGSHREHYIEERIGSHLANADHLYAIKVINKSVLKRMRTMTKEGRKMTVHTALEKVEEEIAIMKQVRRERRDGGEAPSTQGKSPMR